MVSQSLKCSVPTITMTISHPSQPVARWPGNAESTRVLALALVLSSNSTRVDTIRSYTTKKSRARNFARGYAIVNVHQNPRIGRSVELVCCLTARNLGTTTRHFDIDALGIALRSIFLSCRMQGNDLVAQDVLSSCDIRGDGDSL